LLLQELGEPGQASTLCLKASEVYTSLGLLPQSIETYLRSRLADHAFPESEEDLERLETLLYPAHREHLRSLAPDLFKALLLKENVGELGRRLAGRLHLAFPKSTQGVLENLPPRNDAVRSTFLSRVTIQDSPEQVDVPADITLKLLGDYRVFVGDSEVPKKAWKTSKSRILFAQLVEAFPSLLTEDSLVEQLWPGSFAKAKDSLYVACSQVRSALKKSGLEKPTVVKTSTGIHLNKDLVIEYDVANLVGFLESGRKAYKENRLEEAALHFRQAALLGEDSFFPECYLDWALRLRDELEQKLLFACVAVARIDFAQGNHPQALEFARRALRFDRAHEQAVGILLESLIQVGRKAEATRQYDEFVRVMKEDYDIDDVPSFEELRASIS
jgi:DNA-binding SARP family transcriptional activator